MPRSTVYPYQSNGFQRSFNQGATYPYARYESDDEENELNRARELYKNLQGSPGGWQTRALQGQSKNLKRRLGENEQQFRQRAQEYERRLREGEDARSLLGSQLDESRSHYGNLQRQFDDVRSQYNDLQSQFGDERSLYHGKISNFKRQQEDQENQFNKYINKPEIADQILRKKYDLDKNLLDLALKKPWEDVKKYAEEQGYTGNYEKPYQSYQKEKAFPSYEEFEKRNHNKAFMTSLMPQFEAKYPKGDRDEAQHLTNLGYGDPTYSKDPVSFLKQYQKYYPFANEETYKKYPTTDKFRDLSPASKQYLNIDQPNFKNFNKIYKQKLRDQESMSASELQSQSERFSNMWDQSMEPLAQHLKQIDPQQYNAMMEQERQHPRFSQSSVYSLQAPQSFYGSIKSRYETEQQNRQKGETDLHQLRGQFDQQMQKYHQMVQESEQKQNKLSGDVNKLTGDALHWKGQHDAQLPVIQEYKNYRGDVSPLRRNYPSLQSALNQHQKNSAVLTNQNKELLAWKNMHKGAAADYYRKIASNTIPGISYKDVYDAQQMLKKL